MKYVEQAAFAAIEIKSGGKFALDLDNARPPYDLAIQEKTLVRIPSGGVGGNHSHPRVEILVCIDEGAELHWIDPEAQKKTVMSLDPVDGVLQAFLIASNVPHAVVNPTAHGITLLEYADGPLEHIELVVVV